MQICGTDMTEVVVLAIALAMDAFAVSIGLGAKYKQQNNAHSFYLAAYAALYFGMAQGIMPFIGYLLGAAMLGWLAAAAPWIGGFILITLGGKMLYETIKISAGHDKKAVNGELNINTDAAFINSSAPKRLNHRTLFTLAIATSIDAMAAGFTLNLLSLPAWMACLIIAMITAVFGFIGIYLGKQSGIWLEDKAEVLGGVVLIGIGLNVLFFN